MHSGVEAPEASEAREAESPAPAAGARGWRSRSLFKVVIIAVLGLIGVGTITVIGAATLAAKAPTWWRSVDPGDPETIDLAEQVERGVVNTVHRGRPDGEVWTVSVTAAQANAWLNVKLPRWMANRGSAWPARLREIQANFIDGKASFGARIRGVDGDRVVAATIEPVIMTDGSLWILTATPHAGRLDLPRDWTVAQLRDWLPQEVYDRLPAERILDALAAESPLFDEAVLKLEDGRRVRLLGITPEDGRLLLTCVTEVGEETERGRDEETE